MTFRKGVRAVQIVGKSSEFSSDTFHSKCNLQDILEVELSKRNLKSDERL